MYHHCMSTQKYGPQLTSHVIYRFTEELFWRKNTIQHTKNFLEETNGAFWTLSWLIWFVVKLPDALMVGWACVFTSVNSSQVCEKQSWKGKTNESAAQFSHHNFVINKQQGPSRFEFLFFFNIKERPKEDTFKRLWLKGWLTDFYVGIK